jgi:signal transduction histidine kinase
MNEIEQNKQNSSTLILQQHEASNLAVSKICDGFSVSQLCHLVNSTKEIAEQDQLEATLEVLNAELELKVAQRTAELTKMNHQLLKTVEQYQTTERELNLQVERLNRLYSLVLSLNKAQTLDEIYQIALKGICQTFATNSAAILAPDDEGRACYRVATGISDMYRQAVETFLHTTNKLLDNRTVIIPDVTIEPGHSSLDGLRAIENIKAVASFPLRYQQQQLGKVVVYYNEPHLFTAQEIKLAKTIATSVATAISRKQGESALQQTNDRLAATNTELARATQMKDEFLANMSHELRTPLNAILGLSEGLLDQGYGLLNDRQKRAIATIEKSGQHLLALINDILDLAKIESGKSHLCLAPTSIRFLCQSSLSVVSQLATEKQIQCSVTISEDVGLIEVDERKFCQALINLLSNAIKFTPVGGSVSLNVEPHTTPGHVRFSVIDTGIGIAPEHLKQLFQPFIQIDSSLSRQYPGTGLGLALVRRIIELHQGQVTVHSQLGQGSCFTIDLPGHIQAQSFEKGNRLQGESASATCEDTSFFILDPMQVDGANQRLILLAEDSKANTELIVEFLSGCGYRLITAKDGFEAIEMAKTHQPEVILMDIQMPRMDGLTAIQKIRAEADLANIPIIALTALAMTGDREKCLEAGAIEYLTKPIRLKYLLSVIQNLPSS